MTIKRITTAVPDMLRIIDDPNATEQEKSAAASTIVEAIAPDILQEATQNLAGAINHELHLKQSLEHLDGAVGVAHAMLLNAIEPNILRAVYQQADKTKVTKRDVAVAVGKAALLVGVAAMCAGLRIPREPAESMSVDVEELILSMLDEAK